MLTMSDVQSQNDATNMMIHNIDATNMMIHNIDADQEVSYIESVSEPQSVGNVRVTPRGSRYWTPVVPENEKPVKKMLFVSLDQAIEFYNNYAKKAGFEARRSSENKGKHGVITRKYLLCSKEGQNPTTYANTLIEQKGKRVTTSKRTGCEAHIILKYLRKRNLYEVVEFNEEHNHSMVHKDDSHFLNSQRQLNFCQKQTLMDVGNLNMGPRKGFKVLKQARGEDKKLSGLFWADETAKRNYIAFGDIVGFDATFRTQKYFMVFVPFTGIVKPSTMSIKIAIPKVFTTAKQRLCMWHITEKFGDKLGSTLCQSGFLERINDIVWSKTLTPEQFELNWASLMNEYDQQEHKWLSDMYDIHDRWIPSYFRDLPLAGLMQTTSRCEGENYFFGLLTNTDLFLVEFINHFETAMDAQRNIQRNNDHDSRLILLSRRRWTKDVVPPLSCGSCFNLNKISEKKDEIQSLIRESVFFLESVVDRLVNDVSKLSLFRDKQKELMEQVFDDMPYQPPMKNKQVIETILGVTQPDEIEIGNPNISSNKGGIGGKKRLISLKDKAIAKAQKTNLRRCNYCEQLANHDSRNCPVKKKDEEDQRKKLEAQEKSEANKKRGANHQASTSGSNV
ncbi:FAR1-related sequence 5-like protein [Tanacetum coccineum]